MPTPQKLIHCITLSGKAIPIPVEALILRPAAYAILLRDQKLLLLKMKATGKYHLPGGGLETGERVEEGLRREVREETGLNIHVERLAFFKELFFYYDPSRRAYHGLHFYFHCAPVGGSLSMDEQVEDGSAEAPRWVALASLKPEMFQHAGEEILEFCENAPPL